ncbi:A24 family peptidase [Allorhodopirellula solitaria]|uniref:Leader peptidase PppA n=1 Tax=Allorhodopirellula solitaria TaxID=2527987 RepID=A0A5C5YG45_9BACT|nr:prepilin peptidase [Allorhodopirellula solitaria]TWT73335.1 Leader peptidase PppA [Allorhodopirellula solitaria]
MAESIECRLDPNVGHSSYDPFDESLWGEYARMLLVATAACAGVHWSIRLANEPIAAVMVLANVLVVGAAVSDRMAGLPRLMFLSFFASGLSVVLATRPDATFWQDSLAMFSPWFTIGAFGILIFRDGLIATNAHTRPISLGQATVIIAVLISATYMIVIPGMGAVLESQRERSTSYTIEELTPLEVLRIRSAKLAVFAIFAYMGACIGSFLNVVAASTPRGESIVLRSSACPKCETPIRRVDNLPLISFLRLRGRCGACGVSIPIRYFTVEVVGLVIFSSLFLYELVTGAANVPGFQHYPFSGILWIILYTKWPVVGIYFFHCALFSSLLTIALMEQDKLRPPRWLALSLLAVSAILVVVSPNLLTVSLLDQTPLRWPASYPDWLDRAASSLVGGSMGWAIGHFAGSLRLRRRQSTTSLSLAYALVGIALGWQAVLTIAALWWIATWLLKRFGGRRERPSWLTATTILFAVAMLHHPAWRWSSNLLTF